MINNQSEYIQARRHLVAMIRSEMIGPGSEDIGPDLEEEIITDSPVTRYSSGMLFPQGEEAVSGEDDEAQNTVTSHADMDETLDSHVNMANQYKPSAMGISFFADAIGPALGVKISAARYRKLEKEDKCAVNLEKISEEVLKHPDFLQRIDYKEGKLISKYKFKAEECEILLSLSDDKQYIDAIKKLFNQLSRGWKRIPLRKAVVIPSGDELKYSVNIFENFDLVCFKKIDQKNNQTFFTISVINKNVDKEQRDPEKVYFQVNVVVTASDDKSHIFSEYKYISRLSDDQEALSYKLLYRNKQQFATGHGSSAGWDKVEGGKAAVVFTDHMPVCEVPKLGFTNSLVEEKALDALKMKFLANQINSKGIVKALSAFCETYGDWIKELEREGKSLASDFTEIAGKHIRDCQTAYQRIKRGIELIEKDTNVFKAFVWANRAMYVQRRHSEMQKDKHFPGEKKFQGVDYENDSIDEFWRPFQLAFILLCLNSIHDSKDEERDLVDLIWFPTAGGKTEAYLGLAAFTIFLRRLNSTTASGGTTVIMRYTLRLLTSQQFQRATTLTCACELIRLENIKELGKEPITIGLWIGGESSPNTTKSALYYMDSLHSGRNSENPLQLLSCPWCGTKMVKEHGRGIWGYKEGKPKKLILFCPDRECDFHNGLPVLIVDEEIYKSPPTILFGTVDKFALIPWKSEVSKLFASDSDKTLPPELIVQDELHLISGPLGTIVGLYETVIDALCSAKGKRPKIIASTATIRRAEEQCRALYARKVKQFPPPGLNLEDSFFAKEISLNDQPGRFYAGMMSSGKPQTTTIVRLMGTVLQAVGNLDYSDEVKDVYWTLVGYFNTLKELGQCVTLVNDDIKDYVRRMAMRKGEDHREFYEPLEMTSRVKATEIPDRIEELQISYKGNKKGCVPILLASNMISTGVDIDRLGLMAVIGQPKTTSEYIQATSRIGRKYPGLVFTLYDGARPRDRSHYEHFVAYHNAFYNFVEPTSVTPFSGPARERALHALLISFLRHHLGFRKDEKIKDILATANFDEVIDYIGKRVAYIDEKEKEKTIKDLKEIVDELLNRIKDGDNLSYGTLRNPDEVSGSVNQENNLMCQAGREKNGTWETLTSMRNVDSTCNIFVEED